MNKTTIEWVKNPDGPQGYTWNPITGCLNGCEYCYARKLANGRLKARYLLNPRVADSYGQLHDMRSQLWDRVVTDPFYPRFWEDRLTKMKLYTGVGKGIFVCDMSDLFGIGIPEEWTRKVLGATQWNSRNRFYLLTKQPQNLIKFSPFPDNCWVGVSATTFDQYNRALKGLLDVIAKVKFISFEPLLEETINNDRDHGFCNLLAYCRISWVIIGAQTKPYKPPKVEWVQEIIRACDKVGIPVFLKENLMVENDKALASGLWNLERRQEMPTIH